MIKTILSLLATLLGTALMAGEAPGVRVIALADAQHYRHSEGSVTRLADGRLLLVWSRFNGHKDKCGTLGDNGPATLVLAESKDDGATWSEARELPVGTATRNIMQAAFVPVKKGLMLMFSVRWREGHKHEKYVIESQDGGQTWTERRKIFDAGGANDRVIRLKSGRLLVTAHRPAKKFIGKREDRELLVAFSDDEGKTWALSAPLPHEPSKMELKETDPSPALIIEAMVDECADGSVYMLARSGTGVFYDSRSTDGGTTWSELKPTTIESFAAPPYLRRLQDGRLMLLWNPVVGKNGLAAAAKARENLTQFPLGRRERLALMTSTDCGKTWSEPRTIIEDGKFGYCYPWIFENKDGAVVTFCSRTPYTIYPCDLIQLPPFKP